MLSLPLSETAEVSYGLSDLLGCAPEHGTVQTNCFVATRVFPGHSSRATLL